MNGLLNLFSEPWVQRLGWVLIHFLWQGAGVALLLAVALRIFTRASSHVRYVVIGSAFLLCAVLPAATWMILVPQAPPSMPLATVHDLAAVPKVESPIVRGPGSQMDGTLAPMGKVQMRWQDHLSQVADASLPYVVGLWFVGILILTVRLTMGWMLMKRVCLSSIPIHDSFRLERFRVLLERMHVGVPVRLLESALVEVPTLIGWLRPAILVPTSIFIGLTPDQLEAILAHELAHVRRYDYLVNLFQTVIETILFYHPAVWWISRKLREERENCCDDIALEVMQDRLVYASALAQLEEGRAMPLALTASGGSLLQRIRRIAGESTPGHALGLPAILAVISLFGALTAASLLKAQNESSLATPAAMTEAEANQKGIAALVNGKPIYWADVNYSYLSPEPYLKKRFSGDALKQKIAEASLGRVEQYIDRELAIQSAEALGYQTPQSLLDARVEFGVKGFGGDKNAFVKNLENNGLTLEQFNNMNRAADMEGHMMSLKVFNPLETYVKDHLPSSGDSTEQGRKMRQAIYFAEMRKLTHEWTQELRSKAVIQRFYDLKPFANSGGNEPSPAEKTDAKGEFLTVRTFLAPPHFFLGSDLKVTSRTSPDMPAMVEDVDTRARKELSDRGILFPPGSTVAFLSESNKLVVRNTPDQLDKIAALIERQVKDDSVRDTHRTELILRPARDDGAF